MVLFSLEVVTSFDISDNFPNQILSGVFLTSN